MQIYDTATPFHGSMILCSDLEKESYTPPLWLVKKCRRDEVEQFGLVLSINVSVDI